MKIYHFAALACAILPAPVVAQTIYFGENQTPSGGVSGDPVTARDSFLGALTAGVSTENFEGIPLGSPPIILTFNGSLGTINAVLTGDGSLRGSPVTGTYATSGSQFYDNEFEAFTITFETAIAAFGFYGTDIGDVSSPLDITLDFGLTSQRSFTVANTIDGLNSSLLFWGITDTANPFTTVSFAQSGSDRFGFDDLTVGDVQQVTGAIPEPSTWAMLLLGFGAVGGAMRRRSAMAKASKTRLTYT